MKHIKTIVQIQGLSLKMLIKSAKLFIFIVALSPIANLYSFPWPYSQKIKSTPAFSAASASVFVSPTKKVSSGFFSNLSIASSNGFGSGFAIPTVSDPIKELLNISYAYLNIPKGYYNKLMIPYNQNKQVFSYCLIKHADTKYSNSNKLKSLGLKKINIKELIC